MRAPNLTPARIREALLLLQAVEAVGQCAENEGRCASLDIGMPSTKTGEVVIHAYGHEVVSGFAQAPTLAETLTGLLDALGVTPWEWPSAKKAREVEWDVRHARIPSAALRAHFAHAPLTVLAMLAKEAGAALDGERP